MKTILEIFAAFLILQWLRARANVNAITSASYVPLVGSGGIGEIPYGGGAGIITTTPDPIFTSPITGGGGGSGGGTGSGSGGSPSTSAPVGTQTTIIGFGQPPRGFTPRQNTRTGGTVSRTGGTPTRTL